MTKYILPTIIILGLAGISFAAPTITYERHLFPETDSTYDLGTSTPAWRYITGDEFCLTGDSCISTWTSGQVYNWVFDGDFITPSTSVGIFARASSTIDADFRVDGNATTTGHIASLGGNSDQWNLAFGWGDHSLAGYYAAADFNTDWDNRFTATTTWEGFSGLFDTDFAGKSTTDLSEGTNLYWTNARFDDRLIATTTWSGNLTIDGDLGVSGSMGILDADVPDTITASNYLDLTGWYATTTHALISSLPSLDTVGTLTTGNADAIITLGDSVDISSETNLTVGATGIELALDDIALTSGYIIPLTASTTNWNNFYDTPSNRITDGTNISWSTNTLNIDDAFLVNSAADTTSFGITMGSATTSDTFRAEGKATFGGNVGIGTTSPSSKLEVSGDVNYTGAGKQGQLRVSGSTNNNYELMLGYDTTDDFGFITTAKYNTGWRNLALNPDGGNVGIGTTSPNAPLHIVGDYWGTARKPGAVIESERGSIVLYDNTAGQVSNDIRGLRNDDGDLAFLRSTFTSDDYGWDEAVVDMIILDSGNVGIGTTAPFNLFHVYQGGSGGTAHTAVDDILLESNTDAGITIMVPDANLGQLVFATASNNLVGQIYGAYNSGNEHMQLKVGGTDVMRLLDTGNVGIGTTSPAYKLAVAGDILADSYIEYSPKYIGDALLAIKGIKHEQGTEKGNWAKVDHSTLPEKVKVEKQVISTNQIGTTTEEYWDGEATSTREIPIMETTEYTFIGRDLGASVQLNTRGIQQLIERVESLEAVKMGGIKDDRIAELEARINELENRMGIIERFINWFRNIFP